MSLGTHTHTRYLTAKAECRHVYLYACYVVGCNTHRPLQSSGWRPHFWLGRFGLASCPDWCFGGFSRSCSQVYGARFEVLTAVLLKFTFLPECHTTSTGK